MYVCMYVCVVPAMVPSPLSVHRYKDRLYCKYFPCHPTMMCSMIFNIDHSHHNFPERRKPRKQTETHKPSLPPFCANFRLFLPTPFFAVLAPSFSSLRSPKRTIIIRISRTWYEFPLNIYPNLSLLIEPKRGRPKRSGKFVTCTLAECHLLKSVSYCTDGLEPIHK